MQAAEKPRGWLYRFNGSLLSSGTKDFGFTGTANYGVGYDGTGQSYHHVVGTEGTSSTDAGAIYANGITDKFNPSGDFTISTWFRDITAGKGSILALYTVIGTSTTQTGSVFGAPSQVATGWTATNTGRIQKRFCGIRLNYTSGSIDIRVLSSNQNTGSQYRATPPANFDTTAWHHYAITRKDSTMMFFVDGVKIYNATVSGALYASPQVSVCGYWDSATTEPTKSSYAGYADDFYVAEFCKWDSDFDPYAITY